MKRLFCLSVIFLLGVLSACLQFQPSYDGLWFFTYNIDAGPLDRIKLTPASFLELRPDKTFTRDFGRFEYGSWETDHQRLLLSNQYGDKVAVTVRYIKGSDMQLLVNESGIADFEAQTLPSREEDPFSLAKNKWRLKAATAESDEQLRKRLSNHCAFWESYFKWALDNQLTTVDVRSTPTPIKIYGNGFTIKPFSDLPAEWVSYFYDSTDCRKASGIMEQLVQAHSIAWAHTDNKYKMFISAFQQMQEFLK